MKGGESLINFLFLFFFCIYRFILVISGSDTDAPVRQRRNTYSSTDPSSRLCFVDIDQRGCEPKSHNCDINHPHYQKVFLYLLLSLPIHLILFVLFCYVMLYHIVLYYIILYYTILYYIILYYIILYYIILYYITLHYIILHYITLHYIILHYIILHYIILYYIILYYIILMQCRATESS